MSVTLQVREEGFQFGTAEGESLQITEIIICDTIQNNLKWYIMDWLALRKVHSLIIIK